MSSQIRPLEDLAQFDIAYWLPPGGRDNGVWADIWVAIADLETDDASEVLDLLAQADVGGYVAVPGGRRARARGRGLRSPVGRRDAVRPRRGRVDPVHAGSPLPVGSLP